MKLDMICDDCKHMYGYILGADECGAGNPDAYCQKGHWSGLGDMPEHTIDDSDPWKDCQDFASKGE